MGTYRRLRVRAKHNQRLAELLLPPETIKRLMDKQAAERLRDTEAEPEILRALPDVSMVQELPEFDRLVVLAVYWGNLSKSQVAILTKCARDTVRASLERSARALREKMEAI